MAAGEVSSVYQPMPLSSQLTLMIDRTVFGTDSRFDMTVEKPNDLKDSCRYCVMGYVAIPKVRPMMYRGYIS
jgi:hypothetical protein